MTYLVEAEHLAAIAAALRKPAKPFASRSAERRMDALVKTSWMHSSDLEDLLIDLDYRLDGHGAGDVEALTHAFDLLWCPVTYRPRTRSNSAGGLPALSAADVAQLLIHLERCGFTTDPEPLVTLLLPQIKVKPLLTCSELSVFWFTKHRHKRPPIHLAVTRGLAGLTRSETWPLANRYKVEAWSDLEGELCKLVVRAPKYRHRAEPVETTCLACGFAYLRGDTDSSASHRTEHKERMGYLDPQPHPLMLQAMEHDPEPELVSIDSPKWKQWEMYLRAGAFKRELRYSFRQWGMPEIDPHAHGFLFADASGAIVGACAFRLRGEGAQSRWGLQWIWICPEHRRHGHLASRWPSLRARFGDFEIEGPVSPAMKAFAAKQGDAALLN